jgi:hypothetical protein
MQDDGIRDRKRLNRESINVKNNFKKNLKGCKPLALLYAKFVVLLVRKSISFCRESTFLLGFVAE